MRRQRRFFALLGILAGLILVQACARTMPAEQSCNFVQNQKMQRVSWDTTSPVVLYIDDSMPPEFESAVKAAIARWNEVGQSLRKRDFFRLGSGNPGSDRPAIDSYNKIYLMNTWENTKDSEQARTTVYWTGSRIYEADIRINAKDFQFYVSSTPDNSKIHLESLLVHELGHVLGLAHTSHAESVMQVTLASGKDRAEPGHIDVESLTCEY